MFTPAQLLWRGLRHHWRVNLAVVGAVAVAVAVLCGALAVGDSVRASLRRLTLERLGRVDQALVADHYFREQVAASFPGACPLILLNGSAAAAEGGARAGRVQVLAPAPAFWSFSPPDRAPVLSEQDWRGLGEDDAVLNEALARKINARKDDDILLRVPKPSAIPSESFLGRRDETVATLRLRVARVIPAAGLGRFSLSPSQFEPLNLYLPLATMQRKLNEAGRVNALLAAGRANLQAALARPGLLALEDLGLRLRANPEPPYLALESAQIFLPPALASIALSCAKDLHLTAQPALAYLANGIQSGGRAIPYSMVAAVDLATSATGVLGADEITLNQWAADELKARPGDRVGLTYFVPAAQGALAEQTTTLTLARIVPLRAPWTDRGLTPEMPGLANAETLAQWDPPFPLDLKRIRPRDEQYWNKYRATPKGFVALLTGRRLWGNRYGDLTSIRFFGGSKPAIAAALLGKIKPAEAGLRFQPVKAAGLAASQGASDFGGLFLGFSLFLLVAAALLIRILFQLGVESRAKEFGLLSALGFSPRRLRRRMLAEGAILAAAGGMLGTMLGILFAALLIHGLHSWWIGAVGTPFLSLALRPASLAGGFAGGWLVALWAVWVGARGLARQPVRALLAGRIGEDSFAAKRSRAGLLTGIIFLIIGFCLLPLAAARPAQQQAGLFFGAAAALLVAMLAFFAAWLRREPGHAAGRLTLTRLGLSAARRRPGRSLLVAGLMACAVFIVVATGANRQTARPTTDKRSGSGGFTLLAESTLPIYRPLDPKIMVQGGPNTQAYPLRLRAGDDASCLNLYQAARPRILGVPESFIARGGFAFAGVAAGDAAQRENPWLLLNQSFADGAVPAIGDANTVLWLLHRGLGQDLVVDGARLRFVALLKGSVFQSELLIGEEAFKRLFPGEGGWRVFAIAADPAKAPALARALEAQMEDVGLEAAGVAGKLNALLRVENTYLSTFQSLGGLGLILGTLGLALTLLRNLLERRAEFALLRAVGYRFSALVWLAACENILLLLVGLAVGAACALIAIAPSLAARAIEPPWASLGGLLLAIALFGAAATVLSAAAALRAPLVRTLKEE